MNLLGKGCAFDGEIDFELLIDYTRLGNLPAPRDREEVPRMHGRMST
jgi:hypothetical protein